MTPNTIASLATRTCGYFGAMATAGADAVAGMSASGSAGMKVYTAPSEDVAEAARAEVLVFTCSGSVHSVRNSVLSDGRTDKFCGDAIEIRVSRSSSSDGLE